jgi:hypothetical protein
VGSETGNDRGQRRGKEADEKTDADAVGRGWSGLKTKSYTWILLAAFCSAAQAPAPGVQHKLVYNDDGTFGYRPKPKTVDPGTFSTQERAGRPPSDAIVLFDGKDLSKWKPNQWKVVDGELISTTGRFETVDDFGSYQLHLEWKAPNPPVGDNIMDRGNNGVLRRSVINAGPPDMEAHYHKRFTRYLTAIRNGIAQLRTV